MKSQPITNAGFTLMELLLYIGISSILILSLVSHMVLMHQLNVHREVAGQVQDQMLQIRDTIEFQVRNATRILAPTVGNGSPTLMLEMKDSSLGQAQITLQGGALVLTDTLHGTHPFSDVSLNITDVVFTNTSGDGEEGTISYQITGTWMDEKNIMQSSTIEGTVGNLQVTPLTPSTPLICTVFTYSSWGTCQADNTQTRTVATASPTGCTGGTPILAQSCTYSGGGGAQVFTVYVDRNGVFDRTSLSLRVGDTVRFIYSPPIGDQNEIVFNPSNITRIIVDHDHLEQSITVARTGTWTYKVKAKNGNTGTLVVQ